jgi:cytochrome c biogenesis protein CcmG, thiol:disulfide interchange protein DsbE
MSGGDENQASQRSRLIFLVPALVFGAIAIVAVMQLFSGRNLATVPSALLGKPAPVTALGALENLPRFTPETYGVVRVVNVWASWCAPCRQEHPVLLELTKDSRIVLAGINYKDRPENAARFLQDLGNPFDEIGTDANGRAAIDWGVYGVPETFIIGRDNTIRYKHVGPLNDADLKGAFGQALEEAVLK